jgi:hypothetical protein
MRLALKCEEKRDLRPASRRLLRGLEEPEQKGIIGKQYVAARDCVHLVVGEQGVVDDLQPTGHSQGMGLKNIRPWETGEARGQ